MTKKLFVIPIQRFSLPAFLAAILFGCTVGPKYEPPATNVPCDWHCAFSGRTADSPDSYLWWKALKDPTLDCLIEDAVRGNLDLRIAVYRILEARAEHKGGCFAQYPHVDLTATYGHVQYNQHLINKIMDCDCSHGSSKRNLNFYEIGFDAEWEIDLFGKNAHDIRALKARTQATEEELHQVWITLSAEVARNYIELRGHQQRLELIDKEIAAQKETLDLMQGLMSNGFTNINDRRVAEEQLNLFLAQKPQIESAVRRAIHRISVLLGYPPAELYVCLQTPGPLPVLPYCSPIGVPSELLRRRPDIQKVERNLAAATEQVGSAVAAMFPRFSIRGFIGEIAALCNGSFTWFAGPQLLAPIFNSRLLEQDVRINKFKAQQVYYEYQKTVLEALEETENALAAFNCEIERCNYLEKAVESGRESYQEANQLYQHGFKNYLQVLESNRRLVESEESLLQCHIDALTHFIALYKALGGGWDIEVGDGR